jgi:hypothetical protein
MPEDRTLHNYQLLNQMNSLETNTNPFGTGDWLRRWLWETLPEDDGDVSGLLEVDACLRDIPHPQSNRPVNNTLRFLCVGRGWTCGVITQLVWATQLVYNAVSTDDVMKRSIFWDTTPCTR